MNRRVDLLFIIILILAGLKLTYNLEGIVDLDLWDETDYLASGVNLLVKGFPSPYYGPLYSLYYYFLSKFSGDNIFLYYLNLKLQIIIIPVLYYVFLRALNIPNTLSLLASFFFLISYGNIIVSPRPTHFAIMVMLIFLTATTFISNLRLSILLMATTALLLSYIRPEYFLSFILLSIFYLILIIIDIKKTIFNKTEFVGLITFISVSAALIMKLGNPFNDKGQRTLVAFSQHFSYNWVKWHQSNIDPWADSLIIMQKNFGSFKSIPASFLANPPAFLKHVLANLLTYLSSLSTVLFSHINFLLPPADKWLSSMEALLTAFTLLVLLVIYRRRYSFDWQGTFNHKAIIFFFIALYIPSLLSALIIYPRFHYVVPQYIFFVTTLLFLISSNLSALNISRFKQALVIGLLLLAITPYLAGHWYFQDKNEPQSRINNLSTVRFIKSLNLEDKVNILEADGGYDVFLPNNFQLFFAFSKKTLFNDFMHKNDINVIVLSAKMSRDARFQMDPGWQTFMTDYAGRGFAKLTVPGTSRILFIKNPLLPGG